MRWWTLVALVLLAGCGGSAEREQSAKPRHFVDGTSVDGKHVSLADFRGKPVFVIVWSSW